MNQDAFSHLSGQANHLRQQYQIETQIDNQPVYELSIELETPLMIAGAKADIPTPGLPNLDGILQFAAFYWCVREAIKNHPELTQDYLWQVNQAFHTPQNWIDFPVPIRQIPISSAGMGTPGYLYDCSVGLPVDPTTNEVVYPIGDDFLSPAGQRLRPVVDHIPLRRRSIPPEHAHKPVQLTAQLDSQRGDHKALDNRIYYLTVTEYRFYFRGDPGWVCRLLQMMQNDSVGIGKKSSLGYGRIRKIQISGVSHRSTLGWLLTNEQKDALGVPSATVAVALLKNIPTHALFQWCNTDFSENDGLFGHSPLRVLSLVPVLGGYAPPFWMKKNQAVVARYGSLLYGQP